MFTIGKWLSVALMTGIILFRVDRIQGSRILLVSSFPGQSHWLTFEHIVNELLERDHEITAITNYRMKNSDKYSDRYREILIDPIFDFEDGLPMEFYYRSSSFANPYFKLKVLWWLGLETTRHALECKNVQKFIHDDRSQYDLVIAEQFVQESFLLLAHKYQAPVVTINTLGYTDYIDRAFGMITPISYVPHFFTEFTDEMNFYERFYNLLLTIYDWCYRRFIYLPAQNAMARKHFSDFTGENQLLPTVQEMENNVSVILANNHIISHRPRPKMIGMVDIAGVHIRPAKVLPDALKTFLDKSRTVYINFGTFLRSSAMPEETLQVFVQVFRNLPQYNFLWKWETDRAPDLPPNVMLQKWIPQNDVLAHPNLKLFVTHGGIYGAQEAIYWAKPMLFVPFYGDQHSNARKFQKSGLGLTINIANITVEEFQQKILHIVETPSFQDNSNNMAKLFRDNPTDPLQESVYWIEYVIRHRGAAHLKSAAVKLPWYKYMLLDVAASIIFVIYVLIKLAKHGYYRWCRRNVIDSSKKSN
ncbi:UDP-glycosyltransferase UGT5-like [Uranotaenia lowii]|uniref:UDP-glycosyltransferase UGT5-like n=1 Tax=Uranotaenia lowii TaxID=190385 RepID=UPI002478847C|nr:UDP-glycosyltransferase UGT5-like [Uranotaenia lowii]